MSSPTAHPARAGLLLFFCRLELPLWFLAGNPPLLVAAILGGFLLVTGNLYQKVLVLGVGLAGLTVLLSLGGVFDFMRGLFRPKTEKLPVAVAARIEPVLAALRTSGLKISARSLRVVRRDLALAAHVTGTFRPNIVISGGMIVGLLRGDPLARAILAHEAAHITHFDRMLPSMIMFTVLNALGSVLLALLVAIDSPLAWQGSHEPPSPLALLGSIVVTTLILSCVSRRREYMADLHAAYALGSSRDYVQTLSGGSEQGAGGFFHPGMSDRVAALTGAQAGKILRPSWLWCLWWAGQMIMGAASLLEVQDGFRDSDKLALGIAQIGVGLIGLAIELVKPVIARPLLRWAPKQEARSARPAEEIDPVPR